MSHENGNKPDPDDKPLVPQPHGGSIYQGPPRRPVAGPGRPASELRRMSRKGFEERLPELERIARKGIRESDRLRAIDILARYGLGEAKHYDGELVRKLAEAVRSTFSQVDPRVHVALAAVRDVLGDHELTGSLETAIREALGGDDPRLANLADDWKLVIADHMR